MKNIIKLIAIVYCLSWHSVAAANKVDYVQDMIGGNRIMLENIKGKTRITNIDTREYIVVTGELAGKLTNKQYTDMLQQKKIIKQKTTSSLNQNSGDFNVEVGWNTPKQYFNNSSVIYLNISAKSGGDTTLYVTLYRYRSWWYDIQYKTLNFKVPGYYKNFSGYWDQDIIGNNYYYLSLASANGWTWGNYSFYQR